MVNTPNNLLESRRINTFLFALTGMLGFNVMVGWILDIPTLYQVIPGLAPMQFNNALCFLLLGISGISYSQNLTKTHLISAVLGLLLSLITLIQYPLRMDFGIDLLFFDTHSILPTTFSGRMAPNSAAAHTLAFSSLLLFVCAQHWCTRVACVLGASVAGAGIVSLAGYAIELEGGFNWGQYTQMAIHTSFGFFIAGMALGITILPKRMRLERTRFSLWPYMIVLLITVFFIDLQIPQGVAVGLLYVMPLLASWYLTNRNHILWVAVICTGLVFADIQLAEDYLRSPSVTYNQTVSIVAIWVAALIFYFLRAVVDRQKEADLKFKLAVEGTTAGVWDWMDVESDEEWWSPQFYKLLGYENKAIPASVSSFSSLLHPDDKDRTFMMVDRHFTKRAAFLVEYRLKHASGKYRWFQGSGQAIWDEEGRPIRMVGAILDIHSRKLIEQAEHERSVELQQKIKELEQLTYVASHDLQEPVRTIQSFVNLLLEMHGDELGDEQKTYLNFIDQASKRSQQLIIDMLDYSRIGTNKEVVAVDMNRICKEVLTDLTARIKETGATVTHDELPMIEGRETELRLLIQNLLSNAMKFVKKDVTPQIHVGLEQTEDKYIFSVSDNGIGIEEKFLERIFIIFRRLHGKSEYEGTGIGLAHCKKIVETHGGDIWVTSTPGVGSTFYFSTPITPYHAQA